MSHSEQMQEIYSMYLEEKGAVLVTCTRLPTGLFVAGTGNRSRRI